MPRASGAQNLGNITFVKITYCQLLAIIPVDINFPSNPESSVEMQTGKPNRRCRNSCNRSLDFHHSPANTCIPACMFLLLTSFHIMVYLHYHHYTSWLKFKFMLPFASAAALFRKKITHYTLDCCTVCITYLTIVSSCQPSSGSIRSAENVINKNYW